MLAGASRSTIVVAWVAVDVVAGSEAAEAGAAVTVATGGSGDGLAA
jgi:hypothetical protein